MPLLSFLLVFCFALLVGAVSTPLPFARVLELRDPPMAGHDVWILQHLIVRCPAVTGTVPTTGVYDAATAAAVAQFPPANGSSTFDAHVAAALLREYLNDNYIDPSPSFIPEPYLYKVWIPIHNNRSIETMAKLFIRNNGRDSSSSSSSSVEALTFRVRTHGQNFADGTGSPLNQMTSDGATPTGLMEFDLNSPEDDPALYGPYPVNRATKGLLGNAAFLLTNNATTVIRNGILMHTGAWPGWHPPMPMPNSHGCVHSWPNSIKSVWQILTHKAGVQVHQNSHGQIPYPHQAQGLLSIQVNSF